jgi:hypothetical protein
LQTSQQQTILADSNSLAYVRAVNVTSDCTTAPAAPRYLIFINNDTKPQDLTIPSNTNALSGCTRLTPLLQTDATALESGSGLHIHIAAQEIGIFKAQP